MGRNKKSWKVRLLKVLFPFILVGFFSYSFYQLFSGERGVFTWMELRQQVQRLEEQNAQLERQKEGWEKTRIRLSPTEMDVDFLDEYIRRSLPYLKNDEYILYVNTSSKTLEK